MGKYKYLIMLVLLTLVSCGVALPPFDPLENKLLRLIEIYPSQGEELGFEQQVKLKFSAEIAPESVNLDSIFVINSEELPDDPSDIDSDDYEPLEGLYNVEESGDEVTFEPENGFVGSGEYAVVVTSKVSSIEGMPFSNTDPNTPFISTFLVGGAGESSSSFDGNSGGSSPGKEEVEEKPLPPGPSFLVINEVIYDVDGSDTNGDLFIELFGDAGGYLEGYYINLVNGDDGKTYKTIPVDGEYYVPDDGLFVIADVDSSGNTNVENADFRVNFDPQNGPDSIQLVSRDNELLDVVGYGDVPNETAQNGLATYETNPADDASGGSSLSRLEDGLDTDDNSVDFIVTEIPTPGVTNVTVTE